MKKMSGTWRRLAGEGARFVGLDKVGLRLRRQRAQLTTEAKENIARWQPPAPNTNAPLRFPVDQLVVDARYAYTAGNIEPAIALYSRALRLVHRYPPAKNDLDAIAKSLFAEAIAARDSRDIDSAIALLVRSLELNPESGEVRDELTRLLDHLPPRRDLTKECLIMPDPVRADAIYRQAIRTCLEFIAYGGIVGEVLEFGVLAGWTARLFAETMRDLHYLGDLYLFDSFKGLPRAKHEIDAASHDLGRGVWRDEMDISVVEDQIGEPVHEHVRRALSTVISRQRIKVSRGLFSETLKRPLGCKAALVHLDCDLYSSTREVLDALDEYDVLQDGTVLMFDDWNCNRANPAFGQRRAFAEFLDVHAERYAASHFMNYGFNSAAFILHTKASPPEARLDARRF